MSQNKASVLKVFIKPREGASMFEPPDAQLFLKAGYGIAGDNNAHAFSPRQVLLTRYEDLEDFGIRPGELRENIVIRGLEPALFVPGTLIHVGECAKIRLTFHCEPCKRIGHLVRSLKEIVGRRGILGVVLTDGIVKIGDSVLAQPNAYPPLSSRPYERFLAFISQVPSGKVVTYKQVVIGMGVAESYIRAIPRYIQQTSPYEYPIHRVIDSEGNLIVSYVHNQQVKLLDEQVEIKHEIDLFGGNERYYVDLEKYGWTNISLYL